MNFWANLTSIIGLFCGFISIVFSIEGHFTLASWAILFAVVFDGLDGQIARRNPAPSEFGKELDSLIDVVSFGIAPAILGYLFIYRRFYLAAIFALFLYLFCSVMRLARYNVTPKEKITKYFYGLPTTASGGVLASFILIYRNKVGTEIFEFAPTLFLMIVIVLSLLMISHIRYLNLEGVKELFDRKIVVIIVLFSVILAVAVALHKPGITLALYFLIYLIFSPFVIKFWFKDKQ
ncbi:MAG: CDP-diacylglycerol--serine O-phosphatidyltransferase [Candidatus Omnitrophica bacterium]|nr:CDP-diacylglycerol--serine O-phosphatidyltransferase [Candidatus Omnitrophota bacterium]